ncbi:hypothetical protein DXX92_06450 [Thalassotalea euphylliae]|uniref:Uncharacterized protein n=1 Tax=Thalassotalea euphylliae TaxID=1655234 RepID=A0A3E0UEB1_9GAMM|nr:hypothetical protein DXX92_06450 [Thalassotalea euphylliae]
MISSEQPIEKQAIQANAVSGKLDSNKFALVFLIKIFNWLASLVPCRLMSKVNDNTANTHRDNNNKLTNYHETT